MSMTISEGALNFSHQATFFEVFLQDRDRRGRRIPRHLPATVCLRKQHRLLPGAGRQVAAGADPGKEPGRQHPVSGSDQLDGPAGHGQDLLRHPERQGWR